MLRECEVQDVMCLDVGVSSTRSNKKEIEEEIVNLKGNLSGHGTLGDFEHIL